jgi:hypothetical protein
VPILHGSRLGYAKETYYRGKRAKETYYRDLKLYVPILHGSRLEIRLKALDYALPLLYNL